MLPVPLPSRLRVSVMSVSAVLRVMVEMRAMRHALAEKPGRRQTACGWVHDVPFGWDANITIQQS
jgi:hypothetical protein